MIGRGVSLVDLAQQVSAEKLHAGNRPCQRRRENPPKGGRLGHVPDSARHVLDTGILGGNRPANWYRGYGPSRSAACLSERFKPTGNDATDMPGRIASEVAVFGSGRRLVRAGVSRS